MKFYHRWRIQRLTRLEAILLERREDLEPFKRGGHMVDIYYANNRRIEKTRWLLCHHRSKLT